MKGKKKTDKINYYLDIAEVVSARGTCFRRNYGAIIVKDDETISSGYVCTPRGRENCCDLNYCIQEKSKVARGERYELCRSVHAEENAIISAERSKMLASTLYLVGKSYVDGTYVEKSNPCSLCKKMIINTGIKDIYIRDSKKNIDTFLFENLLTMMKRLKGQRVIKTSLK